MQTPSPTKKRKLNPLTLPTSPLTPSPRKRQKCFEWAEHAFHGVPDIFCPASPTSENIPGWSENGQPVDYYSKESKLMLQRGFTPIPYGYVHAVGRACAFDFTFESERGKRLASTEDGVDLITCDGNLEDALPACLRKPDTKAVNLLEINREEEKVSTVNAQPRNQPTDLTPDTDSDTDDKEESNNSAAEIQESFVDSQNVEKQAVPSTSPTRLEDSAPIPRPRNLFGPHVSIDLTQDDDDDQDVPQDVNGCMEPAENANILDGAEMQMTSTPREHDLTSAMAELDGHLPESFEIATAPQSSPNVPEPVTEVSINPDKVLPNSMPKPSTSLITNSFKQQRPSSLPSAAIRPQDSLYKKTKALRAWSSTELVGAGNTTVLTHSRDSSPDIIGDSIPENRNSLILVGQSASFQHSRTAPLDPLSIGAFLAEKPTFAPLLPLKKDEGLLAVENKDNSTTFRIRKNSEVANSGEADAVMNMGSIFERAKRTGKSPARAKTISSSSDSLTDEIRKAVQSQLASAPTSEGLMKGEIDADKFDSRKYVNDASLSRTLAQNASETPSTNTAISEAVASKDAAVRLNCSFSPDDALKIPSAEESQPMSFVSGFESASQVDMVDRMSGVSGFLQDELGGESLLHQSL